MAQYREEWLERVPARSDADRSDDRGLSDGFSAGAARLLERDRSELIDAWYWTDRISRSFDVLQEVLRTIPGVDRVNVGFVEELDGAFGIIAYTEALGGPDGPDVDDPSQSVLRTEVSIGQQTFPVVARQVVTEQHWCTAPEVVGPTIGRATCWVRSVSRGYEGWLVPRHVADPLGARLDFSDGGSGWQVDGFGQCIDAVVVSSTLGNQHSHSPVRACWPVVAGQRLLVTDSPGSHVPITIVGVDISFGVLGSVMFPIRFVTDWTGRPGQSGALMVEARTGEPAGSYLGTLNPVLSGGIGPGGPSGYAQACFQLEASAGLEFFT